MNELLLDGWVVDGTPPLGSLIWIKTDCGIYASRYDEYGYEIPKSMIAQGFAVVKGWKYRRDTRSPYNGEF